MACCLIAMMLVAQCMATLRRWGAFWGLVPVPDGIEYKTVFDHARDWFRRPVVRAVLAIVVVGGLAAGSAWIHGDHRHHVAQLADEARASGQPAIAAPACDRRGGDCQVSVALDRGNSIAHLFG